MGSDKMKCLVLTALLFQSVCTTTRAEISSSKEDDKGGRQLYRPQSLWEVILLPDTYFNRRSGTSTTTPAPEASGTERNMVTASKDPPRSEKGPSKSFTWPYISQKKGRKIIIDPTYGVGCVSEGFFPTTQNFRATPSDDTCTQGFYWCKKGEHGLRGLKFRCPNGYAFQKKNRARCQKLSRLSGCIFHQDTAVLAAP